MSDPHRPRYHLTAPFGWMNDPNGLIHYGGEYHLFYQHNPDGPTWGNIHWRHAASPDLVRWQDLGIALAPTPGGPDEGGCWSGCAVVHEGVPTLVYTGARDFDPVTHLSASRPCLATSEDGLRTWRKHGAVLESPPDLDLVGFRDHCLWLEDSVWQHLVGAGVNGLGGTALLYRSRDLREWEYVGPILVGDRESFDPVWTGSMWECPQLIPFGDRHVLVVSVWHERQGHGVAYLAGRYADGRLEPQAGGVLDSGSFYAPQAMRDEAGRWIMFGWLPEGPGAPEGQTWAGAMSLPRVLSLTPEGHLAQEPALEIASLRGRGWRLTGREVAGWVTLEPRGDALEILARLRPSGAARCGLAVRRSPDGAERTLIVYDRAENRLTVEPSGGEACAAELALGPGEALELRVFLDASVLEVFHNGGRCLSSRLYPKGQDSLGLALVAEGGTAELESLEVWEMALNRNA